MTDPNELRALGERLLTLAEAETPHKARAKPALSDEAYDDRYLAGLAHSLYTARRIRDREFDPHLFGEPAWDMLLDLFVRATQGKRTAVSSLCLASAVPATTALRWIGTLQDDGLIIREEAEHDRRVGYLTLSGDGYLAVRRYLIEIVRLVQPTQAFFPLQEEKRR